MNLFAAISIEHYRANTAASKPPYVHRRNTCSCGKQITVKQLSQYGHCRTCARAASKAGSA
jgi:hypothetical protein